MFSLSKQTEDKDPDIRVSRGSTTGHASPNGRPMTPPYIYSVIEQDGRVYHSDRPSPRPSPDLPNTPADLTSADTSSVQ